MKRRRQRQAENHEDIDAGPCGVEGCAASGLYRAPKQSEPGYHFFCLHHVREYNKNYNYFAGMDACAAEAFRKDAMIGHRPTWRIGQAPRISELEIDAHIKYWFGDHGPRDPQRHPGHAALPDKVRRALELFDLTHPVDMMMIKQQYRQLVKRYHPDVSNEQHAEAMFKRIMEAYQLLAAHYQDA